jgi:Tfp pilus assembly protein PilZ
LEIVEEEGSGVPLSCFDLSAGGAYLHSDYLFCLGESIRLRIRIADRPLPIDIEGEVIRVETGENGLVPGMGIAFRKIGKQDSDELRRFLMRRFLTHG